MMHGQTQIKFRYKLVDLNKHCSLYNNKKDRRRSRSYLGINTVVPFVVSRGTADLSHRKPESAGTARDSGLAEGSSKSDCM